MLGTDSQPNHNGLAAHLERREADAVIAKEAQKMELFGIAAFGILVIAWVVLPSRMPSAKVEVVAEREAA